MNYLKSLSLKRAFTLLKYAQEQEEKELLFRYYLTQLPYMDKKNYMTFEQYLDRNLPSKAKLDQRPMDEIMDDIMNIKVE